MTSLPLNRLFAAITAVAIACTAMAAAPNLGDKKWFQSIELGTSASLSAKNSLGAVAPGANMGRIPVGTIYGATYVGNGYWECEPFGYDRKLIVLKGSGTCEIIDPELANPRQLMNNGKAYKRETYASEYPSLGDLPNRIESITLNSSKSNDGSFDCVIEVATTTDADTKKPVTAKTTYLGKTEPFCIMVTHRTGPGGTTAIEPFAIWPGIMWVGSKFDRAPDELYINGNAYQ